MSSNSIEAIFKESFDKLNSILMYLDHQLGTVSLTKEEIESLGGVKNEVESAHKILEEKKETQKKEKKKNEKVEKKEEKVEKKEEKVEKKEGKKEKKELNIEKKPENKKVKKEEDKKEDNTEKPDKKKKKKGESEEGKKESQSENKKEEKKHVQKKAMEPKEVFKLCDLRVGYVEECTILEGFNDIYSLVIDLGESNKRIIGTGLRNYVPIENIKNTKLVVFSNLKPKKFGTNFESNGMILTASMKDGDKKIYELIRPNENAKPGEKVFLEGTELDPKKESTITPKRFGQAMEHLKTNDECFCTYEGVKLRTESGFVKASLKNAPIS